MRATASALVAESASATDARALESVSERIVRRVEASRAGETLSSSTPSPTSSSNVSGSPAASPQTSTWMPALWAAVTARAISRSTAGCYA
ncbi:MAG: hypothetical protein QOJ47_176, partial [Gaiellales bacterium]|nr:hypothetical protein [Gaiellales bacterium]